MKKSQLKKLIKEIVKQTTLMENISDPTKEEMLQFLQQQFGREEVFEGDAEAAMYWFANFNHGGQFSNLYSVLSSSEYTPGRIANGPEKNSSEEMMYQSLESRFGNGEEIKESEEPEKSEDALYVEYIRQRAGEKPFILHG